VYYSNNQASHSKVAMALEPFPSECLVMPRYYRCEKQGKGAEPAYQADDDLPIFLRLNPLFLHSRFELRLQVNNDLEKIRLASSSSFWVFPRCRRTRGNTFFSTAQHLLTNYVYDDVAKVKRFLRHLIIDMGFNKKALMGNTLTVGKEVLNYLQISTTSWYKVNNVLLIN
jgi:hypothetical protein